MKKIKITLLLILFNTSCIYASSVYFSFQGFTGSYFIDTYTPMYNAPLNNSEVMFNLAAGTHTFGINGYPFAEVTFVIGVDGKITNVSNAIAAIGKDTLVKGIQAAKLIFHTSKIFINACSAFYVLSAYDNPYPLYQKFSKYFVLIKGLSYFIATDFSTIKMAGPEFPSTDVPELFWFSVNAKGEVHPKDSSLVNLLGATYKQKTLKLNTIAVKINLTDYQTTAIRIAGYDYITQNSNLYFIRGLGIWIRYNVKGEQKNFYFIPM